MYVQKKIRKVLSFDVGIINLAYCILEINDDDKTFKILAWGIIDLASNDKQTCKYIIRGGSICNKVATRMVKINDDNIDHYCTLHIKKAELVTKNLNIVWSPIKLVDVG